jgi:hypothetical protein
VREIVTSCGGYILAKILFLFLYSDALAKGFIFHKIHSDYSIGNHLPFFLKKKESAPAWFNGVAYNCCLNMIEETFLFA